LVFQGLPMIGNEIKLYSMAKDLYAMDPPGKSVLLSKSRKIGIQVGAGNHCDYYAGVLLNSDLSAEELETYYGKRIVEGNQSNRWLQVSSVKWADGKISVRPGTKTSDYGNSWEELKDVRSLLPDGLLEEISGYKLDNKLKGKVLYLVWVFDQASSGFLFNDMRCH